MKLNPIPGTTRDQHDGGYASDSGLDILVPVGTECITPLSGRIVYSEQGHTPWWEDTDLSKPGFQPPWSVLIQLDNPFRDENTGRIVRYLWYTHLTKVARQVPDGGYAPIEAGATVGWTGIGNKVPHLHYGLLMERAQGPGDYLPMQVVRDYVWPPGEPETPDPDTTHKVPKRLKVFHHDGITRVYSNGAEVHSTQVKVYVHSDQLGVSLNGLVVEPVALTVDLAYHPKNGE